MRGGRLMDAERFQRVAKALADPRRFEMLEAIGAAPELACQRLCNCFPVSQATISHHLKELRQAGLITMERRGKNRLCGVNQEAVASLAAYLAGEQENEKGKTNDACCG